MFLPDPIPEDEVVDYLGDFEEGDISKEDVIRLFATLIRTGTIHHLQGGFARFGNTLVKSGYIDPKGNILKVDG